ncbi:MAG: esterase-like activity of phytase family protein [Erythrobacter sp.]|uniref:esterase-like activity of phytase family protein n=1 Tax=Erythrobacter sp. TaxID=1042 RepID=UPI002624E1B3|nr:esterase-like activity of phytase family protein [Erythrobacter sp.]MDJ0978538.1 esterase-like activity of phytase family protein [Erythrobacter sp.]
MKRFVLTLLLAVGLVPGTWVRSPITQGFELPIHARAVDEPGGRPPAGWTLKGVWEYESDGLFFGGYSALLDMGGPRMRAFSDRGAYFTLTLPDAPPRAVVAGAAGAAGAAETDVQAPQALGYQPVEKAYQTLLWDIESATRGPATGQYWLGYENTHAIHRYTRAHAADGVRVIEDEVDWPLNAGAEAMVRLADGRFLVVPERGREALLYPSDPVTGAAPIIIPYEAPPGDFGVTEVKQLPDGRLLFLLRRVVWSVPPFEARLAIAEAPGAGVDGGGDSGGDSDTALALRPRIALDLTSVAPPENYEALAVRKREDGALDIWVLSDDNFAAMQRTLLVKLRFDPETAAREERKKKTRKPLSKPAKEKARE